MKSVLTLLSGALLAFPVMAQQTVDVHCHNVLPEFMEFLERNEASMEETFPLPEWNAEAHLRFMDEAGIELSVLSMPAPQPYHGDADENRRIVRRYNEACARLKSECPGRFLFCASLPLPDVAAAVEEAVYALDTLGADGIKLATNSRGQYLGDPALDSLMDVLNERHAVVILHPHRPVPVNDGLIASVPLAAYEYPAETTRTVLNMIAHNVPARYPDVRFVIPHCGSFLPLALPRMEAIHRAMVAKGLMGTIDWERSLRNFYYDLAGNPTPEVVRTLLTITAPEHLLYGSDYPYLSADALAGNLKRLRAWLSEDKELASHADGIFSGNALRLFAKPKTDTQ